jgi:hypothetical protein
VVDYILELASIAERSVTPEELGRDPDAPEAPQPEAPQVA